MSKKILTIIMILCMVLGTGTFAYADVIPDYTGIDETGNLLGEEETLEQGGSLSEEAQLASPDAINSTSALKTAINAASNGGTIEVTGSFELTEKITISGKSITITSSGGPWTITRGSGVTGKLIAVGSGAGLTLDNITIDGNKNVVEDAEGALVDVNGTFTMKSGAKLQNNITYISAGGGVYVGGGGTFTIDDGTISGNSATSGGGVYVYSGKFTMNGGTIENNTTSGYGGGVNVNGGTFTMNGGTISGNAASQNGGGVNVADNGTFKLSGAASITDNTKTGGTTANNVYLRIGKTITLTGALTGGDGAAIGVTTEDKPDADSPVTIANAVSGYAIKDSDLDKFTSDNGEYKLALESGSIKLKAKGQTISVPSANTNLVYNGETQTALATPADTAGYTFTEDSQLSGKNAGTYTATAQLKEGYEWDDAENPTGTQSVEWTIGKRTLTVTPNSNQGVAYNEPIPTLTYAYSGQVEGETPKFTGALTTTATQGSTKGTYPISNGDLALENNGTFLKDNYELVFTEEVVNFTIGKANQAELKIDEITGAVYGDTVTLGTTGGTGDGEVTYSVVSGSGVITGNELKITGAGNITIKAVKAGGDNYNDAVKEYTFTADQKPITVTVNSAEKTYGETNPVFSAIVTGGSLVGTDSIADLGLGLTSTATQTSVVGTYNVTGDGEYNSNYNVTVVGTDKLTINQRPVTVTGVAVKEKVYDGTKTADINYAGDVNGKVGDDDVTVSKTGATATFENKNVGENKAVTIEGLTLTGTAAGNYQLSAQPTGVTANITAKPLTITAENKQSRKGQNQVALTYTLEPVALATGDTFDGSLALATGFDINAAGDYDILQGSLKVSDGNNGDNYVITFNKGTYKVLEKEEQTIAFAEATVTKTYGDAAFTNAATGPADGGAITYSSDNTDVATVDENTGEVTILKVGQANIVATAAETADYAEGTATYTLKVEKKSVTITNVTVKEKVYDGTKTADINYAGDVNGKVGDDDVTVSKTGATATFENKNVGENKAVTIEGLTLTGTAAGNYQLSAQPTGVTANITAKPLTITAENKQSRKGQNQVALTYTSEPVALATGDTFDGSLALATGFDINAAGDYDILQGSLKVSDENNGDNYVITFNKGTYKVLEKEAQTIAFAEATVTKTYGDEAFKVEVKADSIKDNANVTYAGEAGKEKVATVGTDGTVTIKGAGEITITATAVATADYEAGTTTYTLKVEKKSVTITGVTVKEKVYDGTKTADINYAGDVNGKVGDDDVTVSKTGATATFENKNVGENKAVTIEGLTLTGTAAGNYQLSAQPTGVTASITAKNISEATIADIDPQGYTGSQITPEPQVTIVLVEGGQTVTLVKGTDYTVSYGTNTAPTNGATVTITGKGNYTGTKEKTFTIKSTPSRQDDGSVIIPGVDGGADIVISRGTDGVEPTITGDTVTVPAGATVTQGTTKTTTVSGGKATVDSSGEVTPGSGATVVTKDSENNTAAIKKGDTTTTVTTGNLNEVTVNNDGKITVPAGSEVKTGNTTTTVSGGKAAVDPATGEVAPGSGATAVTKENNEVTKVVTKDNDGNTTTVTKDETTGTVTTTEQDATGKTTSTTVVTPSGDEKPTINTNGTVVQPNNSTSVTTKGDEVTEVVTKDNDGKTTTVTKDETTGTVTTTEKTDDGQTTSTTVVTPSGDEKPTIEETGEVKVPGGSTVTKEEGGVTTTTIAAKCTATSSAVTVTNVKTAPAQEYAIVNGNGAAPAENDKWNTTGSFTGLTASTTYTVYTRLKAEGSAAAGEPIGTIVTTKAASPTGGGGGGGAAPAAQKPTVEAGEGAKVTLSADGTTATITAQEGYKITDVTLNGVSKGTVTTVSGLKTGDTLVVKAAKKEASLTEEEQKKAEAITGFKPSAKSKLTKMKSGKKAIRITWTKSEYDFDGVEVWRSMKRNSGYGKKPMWIIKAKNTKYYYNTAIKKGKTYYYKLRGYVEINGQKYYTSFSNKVYRTVK